MLALFLIACSMIYAHNIATNHVKKSVNKATVINTAGMQRMLSQRVGLLAREIVDSEDYTLSRNFEAKFAVALESPIGDLQTPRL
jgi:nitrate/nitrite-specific signal transduction histidine kinase